MPEPSSLISLGELSKPATVLIEKISEAVGGIFRPYQIRRMAEAKADAQSIEARASLEVSELQRRAMHRFLVEEGYKQGNMESIISKAIPNLAVDALPENIERDWITNFFDKSRSISNSEMQNLWANLLAGEVNHPGFCSKRTVNLLASMDRTEAQFFKVFCSFAWHVGESTPLIFDTSFSIYKNAGVRTTSLHNLELAGLIKSETVTKFGRFDLAQDFIVRYHDQEYRLHFPMAEGNTLDIGGVLFTEPGQQLAAISGSVPNVQFREYVLAYWRSQGVVIF